jgi:hypothetical protein
MVTSDLIATLEGLTGPKRAKAAPYAAHNFIADVAIPYEGEDCLIWPFGRTADGYGGISIRGNKMEAHRVICIEVHGQPPTRKHHAAHTCGNGRKGCVNPHHLRWATPAENEHDKLLHGTIVRGEKGVQTKLTRQQVLEIRSLRGQITNKEIAIRYGVALSTISMIQIGLNWKWLKDGQSEASAEHEARDGTE